ncbi:MAG: T9SS type A sorting domain-containing protein [Paludibacteraceae bacterium]
MKTHLLILFMLLGFLPVAAQNIHLGIISNDGVQKSVELSNLKNITFSDSDLKLNYWSGINELLPVSSIRKLVFTSSTGLKTIDNTNVVLMYPNPVVDIFSLKNVPENHINIEIYSITGTQILNLRNISSSQTINISSLTKGMYFLKVNNQTVKFIKL